MRTIVATTPAGAAWRVRVVWQPRWRALARRFGGWRRRRKGDSGVGGGGWDLGGIGLGDDLLIGLAIIVGLIVFGLLFWFVLLPLLLLVVDLLVVIVVAALAIPIRVLLGRPWTIEAVTRSADGEEERFVTETVGWRRALASRDEIADKLRSGGRWVQP